MNRPNERNSDLFFRPVQSGACALVPTTLVNRVIFFYTWGLLMRLFSYYGSSDIFQLLIRDHPFMCAGLTGIAKASYVVNDFLLSNF